MKISPQLLARSVCRIGLPTQLMAKAQVSLQSKPSLRAALSYYATTQPEDGRVFILGIGNIGRLFAHSLAKKPSPPPMTLLLHRSALMRQWEEAGKCIEMMRNGSSDKQYAFGTELLARDDDSVLSGGLIRNLIVGTKAIHTTAAISRIKHRLNEQSTILFTQNGMGVTEEVSEQLFPDIKSRPNFVASIVSHGVSHVNAFSSIHAGLGAAIIGVLPRGQLVDARKDGSDATPSKEPSRYLIQQLLDTPSLAAKEVSTTEVILARMEKLIMNAMINPLTVILDRRNGELFGYPKIRSLMQLLLGEASLVLLALPELRKTTGLASRFSPDRLEGLVINIAKINANNRSSMLQDVKDSRHTEIDYINGYIIRRGEQLGIDCLHNRTLVKMVKEKRVINESQIDDFFPS